MVSFLSVDKRLYYVVWACFCGGLLGIWEELYTFIFLGAVVLRTAMRGFLFMVLFIIIVSIKWMICINCRLKGVFGGVVRLRSGVTGYYVDETPPVQVCASGARP